MNRQKRILIVDDDPEARDFIESLLSSSFTVLKVGDVSETLATIASLEPDLILIDIKLRDENGLDLCETLRKGLRTRHIPVIIYTGAEDDEALIQAFDRGADDYIPKATRTRELIARIAAKIRRHGERDDSTDMIYCGNLSVDIRTFEAHIDGRQLSLSLLEFSLLRFFISNKGQIMSRQQILDGVWKNTVVSDRTIDTHMVHLRKKLVGFNHTLATVYGAGYVLTDKTVIPSASRSQQFA
jgi:DNA-binding response OmpR family regulator